jgi:flagellar motility protein MotE (MotC chaperone)
MNKKVLLITAGLGVLGFGGALAIGWFTTPAASVAAPAPTTAAETTKPPAPVAGGPHLMAPPSGNTENDKMLAMTQEQLQELIGEVRDTIQEYNTKLAGLEKEKERFRIAQQTLKKDIETLNNMRTELATAVADLKSERDQLLKTRVQVEQAEKNNLQTIATAYDKMDAARASEILTSMVKGQSAGTTHGSSADDAVKILYYMQERTKAKVLAELVATEPALAALLCQKLKQVTETN